jgi:hypothetical protein
MGIMKIFKVTRMVLFLFCVSYYTHATHKVDQRVMFVGDSHSVGPFGQHLDFLLRKQGYLVYTAASCGSTLKHWLTGKNTTCGFFSKNIKGQVVEYKKGPTPLLKNIFNEVKPNILLIEMGANYQYYTSERQIQEEIQNVLKVYVPMVDRCIWVTHPDSRKYPEQRLKLAQLINETVAPFCEVFHSYEVTQYPSSGGDGVHYSFGAAIPIAKNWAKLVFERFFN